KDGGALPGLDPGEIGLAKIANRVPMLGVDDSKERMTSTCEFASGDLERGDSTVAWRTHCSLVEVALRKRERCARVVQLCFGGLWPGDALAGLCGKQPRPIECDLRGRFGGTRLINLFGRHEAALQQRLQPIQRACGERELSLGGADPARCGLGSGSL